MDADEVLSKAWQAVQGSGVPESLYDTAFKEAVRLLVLDGDSSPVPEVVKPQKPIGQQGARGKSEAKAEEQFAGSATVDVDALHDPGHRVRD